jgi:hypothetical protein
MAGGGVLGMAAILITVFFHLPATVLSVYLSATKRAEQTCMGPGIGTRKQEQETEGNRTNRGG